MTKSLYDQHEPAVRIIAQLLNAGGFETEDVDQRLDADKILAMVNIVEDHLLRTVKRTMLEFATIEHVQAELAAHGVRHIELDE